MKAKVKATGEIIEVERVSKNIFGRTDGIVAMYSKDVLDFNLDPPHPEATISGWVCRDKDGTLCLYYKKPMRGKEEWFGIYDRQLPEDSFPSLTWQDEPIEVEITIKPKKQ